MPKANSIYSQQYSTDGLPKINEKSWLTRSGAAQSDHRTVLHQKMNLTRQRYSLKRTQKYTRHKSGHT